MHKAGLAGLAVIFVAGAWLWQTPFASLPARGGTVDGATGMDITVGAALAAVGFAGFFAALSGRVRELYALAADRGPSQDSDGLATLGVAAAQPLYRFLPDARLGRLRRMLKPGSDSRLAEVAVAVAWLGSAVTMLPGLLRTVAQIRDGPVRPHGRGRDDGRRRRAGRDRRAARLCRQGVEGGGLGTRRPPRVGAAGEVVARRVLPSARPRWGGASPPTSTIGGPSGRHYRLTRDWLIRRLFDPASF